MKPTADSKVGTVLRHAPSRAVLLSSPGVPGSPYIEMLRHITMHELYIVHMGESLSSLESTLEAMPDIPSPGDRDAANASVVPTEAYEGDQVQRGSAIVTSPLTTTQYAIYEIALSGPSHGNPFLEVALSATFRHGDTQVDVPGFYDGDGTYRIRFMPEHRGEYSFTTSSNARSLDGLTASFTCLAALPGAHGAVRVIDTFHFAHADGTPFRPIGTTAYGWNHQGDEREQQTLDTLATSAFNKVRMCVFPKWYPHNVVEPQFHAFELRDDGTFDLGRFNPAFFAHLEQRISDLAAHGVEADLILFHPYDKWGYCDMPPSADHRYLRYLIARLSAHANVWWSLANEWDFLDVKEVDDWTRIGELVHDADPHQHLLGVHNGWKLWDHNDSWVTHCSIQSQAPETQPHSTNLMRERWGKPVMIDECCYEGDIEFGFGNLSGEDMTQRFWDATVRGGYVTHGECYRDPDDTLWWGKGGVLKGTSPQRLLFLKEILASAPGPLEPYNSRRGYATAAAGDSWFLGHHGARQPGVRTIEAPAGRDYRVELLDTWNMTITDLGIHAARAEVEVPVRPYLALRVVAVS